VAGQRLRFKRAAKESVECVGGERQRIVARRSLRAFTARATKREDEQRMSTLLIGATLRSLRTKIIHNNRELST
jgi:hypothetical protein